MYVSKNNMMQDNHIITSFIGQYPFATVISPSLDATHLPLLYKPQEGNLGTLYGHMAKANAHFKQFKTEQKALAVFTGPHAYISASWYQSSPNVPTWNYAAVHCKGLVSLLTDEQSLSTIDELLALYEPELLGNESHDYVSYKDKLLNAIVSFKIEIAHIDAKEKLGQQRSNADQVAVYKALKESKNPNTNSLVNYMDNRNLGKGESQ